MLRPSSSRYRKSNLTAIGGQGGPLAAFGALATDLASNLISDAGDAADEAAALQGQTAGQTAGMEAARTGQALQLPTGDSVHDQAFKKAALAGWAARFDVDSATKAETWAAEHAQNPDRFAANWQTYADATLKMVPAEMQPAIRAELDRRGQTTLGHLQAAKIKSDRADLENRQNADITSAMMQAERDSDIAWRSNNAALGQASDAKWRAYLENRTDLTAMQRVEALDKFARSRARSASLGEFDRAKTRGLASAEAFIRTFRQGGHGLDPDDVDRWSAEMERDTADLRAKHAQAVNDLEAQARTALFRAENGFDGGDLSKFADRARALGATQLALELTDAARSASLRGELSKLPLPELRARATELHVIAASSSDAGSVKRAAMAASALEAKTRAVSSDFVGTLRGQGENLGAINWDDPTTLQNRAAAVSVAARKNGLRSAPLLDHGEAADLVDRLDRGTWEDKARMLGNLHAGFGTALPQVLDGIKEKAPEYAHAGALWGQGRAGQKAAHDILFGAELRRTVGKDGAAGGRQYMPPKDENFKTALETTLPSAVTAGMDPAQVEGLRQTIMSSYAAKSHAAGNASQLSVDGKTLKAAVTDVTGGVVSWNGRSFFAPVPGMTQPQLTSLLDELNDAHLPVAQTADGKPVTAAQVRKWGSFHMTEPGKYAIEIGGGFVTTPSGQPYELDLGALARARGMGGR